MPYSDKSLGQSSCHSWLKQRLTMWQEKGEESAILCTFAVTEFSDRQWPIWITFIPEDTKAESEFTTWHKWIFNQTEKKLIAHFPVSWLFTISKFCSIGYQNRKKEQLVNTNHWHCCCVWLLPIEQHLNKCAQHNSNYSFARAQWFLSIDVNDLLNTLL